MNENTLISVHCYAGDAHRVVHALPLFQHHERPVVVISPTDSRVVLQGVDCQFGGNVGYIGQNSLDRQFRHLQILLGHPFEYFLMHDSDSFCLSPEIPRGLYENCDGVVWSNEVPEPRPHASPYPKIAMQPSYFCNRKSLERLVDVMPRISAHPITPYVDWFMLAATCESGLKHRSFGELEHAPKSQEPSPGQSDPWAGLMWRIRNCGAVMMHPIKTPEQVALCRKAYEARS